MRNSQTYNLYEEDFASQQFHEQLPFVISLQPVTRIGVGALTATKLAGHTRCLSATGLQLVGPFTLFCNRFSVGKHQPFQMLLGLPGGAIRLRAEAVSFTQLDEQEAGLGYLIAEQDGDKEGGDMNCIIKARITSTGDNDYKQYLKYLRSLRQRQSEQTVMIMENDGTWREQTLTVTVLA